MINLKTLKLEIIDYQNIKHLSFLKNLMSSKDMSYLWDLTDKDLDNNQNKGNYLVINEMNNYIGYVNISDPTEAYYGKTTSIYYAIESSHRGHEYGKRIIEEISNWLFADKDIDCIVAQVDNQNGYSINTLNKAGMIEVNRDEDYSTFIQRKSK